MWVGTRADNIPHIFRIIQKFNIRKLPASRVYRIVNILMRYRHKLEQGHYRHQKIIKFIQKLYSFLLFISFSNEYAFHQPKSWVIVRSNRSSPSLPLLPRRYREEISLEFPINIFHLNSISLSCLSFFSLSHTTLHRRPKLGEIKPVAIIDVVCCVSVTVKLVSEKRRRGTSMLIYGKPEIFRRLEISTNQRFEFDETRWWCSRWD